MKLGAVLRPLAAGVAAFLVVTVAVTELLAPRIEFSLFVGLPAGVAAGLVAAALVAYQEGSTGPGHRRGAVALGNAAVAYLLVLLGAVWLVGVPVLLATGVAAVAGLLAGVVSFVVG